MSNSAPILDMIDLLPLSHQCARLYCPIVKLDIQIQLGFHLSNANHFILAIGFAQIQMAIMQSATRYNGETRK